jgi:hypothetical protein
MKSALVTASLATLLLASTSQACTRLGTGGPDDSDCMAVMADLFANQATAPAIADVSGKIFARETYDEKSKKWSDQGERAGFLRGNFWLYWNSNRNKKSELEFYKDVVNGSSAKPIQFTDHSLQSPERPGRCDLYVARKWKNFLITAYGCTGDFATPGKIAGTLALSDLRAVLYSENASEAEAIAMLQSGTADGIESGVYSLLANPTALPHAILPMLDVVRGNVVSAQVRADALSGLLGLNDQRVNSSAEGFFNDVSTAVEVKRAILSYGNYRATPMEVAASIQAGTNSPLFLTAVERATVSRLQIAVLPLVDSMNPAMDKTTLIRIASALARIGSDRALPRLKETDLFNHADAQIRTAVRNAVEAIEIQKNVAKIATGDRTAIEWSKTIIKYNDGSKRELMDQILMAYRKPSIPSAVRANIVSFLKTEIASGYHDYAPTLVQEMKNTVKAIHP